MKQKAFLYIFLSVFLVVPFGVFALQAPFDVRAVDQQTGGTLTISWANHNEATVASAAVYRSQQKDVVGSKIFDRVTTNFVNDSGLIDGQKYYYTVVLYDQSGNQSLASAQALGIPSILTYPPSYPENIQITDLYNGNSVRIEWIAPRIRNLAFFRIYRRATGASEYQLIADHVSNQSYVDSGLQAGTKYEYTVKTVSTAGIESTNTSITATPTLDQVPPTLPTNFQVEDTKGGGEIRLTWTNPRDNDFSMIRVYRSQTGALGVVVSEITTGASQYIDSNLEVGSTYYYTLKSVDKAGLESTGSPQLKAKPSYPGAVQLPVTQLSATDRGTGGAIDLRWSTPNDTNFVSTRIYRSTADNDLGIIIADNLRGSSYTDTPLPNGIFFYYTLKTLSKSNIEGVGVTVKAMATALTRDKTKPAPPLNITVQDAGDGSTLRIRFQTQNDPSLSHFRIYRSLESGALGTMIADNYHFTSYDDLHLLPDKVYFYVVRTVNKNGIESDNLRQGVGIPTQVLPQELIPGNDSDGDRLPDTWERAYGLHVRIPDDTRLDLDGDGLSTIDEYRWGTNPWDPDTDGDGYTDGLEVSKGYSPIQGKGVRLELKVSQKMPPTKKITPKK